MIKLQQLYYKKNFQQTTKMRNEKKNIRANKIMNDLMGV